MWNTFQFQCKFLIFALEKYFNFETDYEKGKKEVNWIIRKWNETFLLEQYSLSNFSVFTEDFHIDGIDILIFGVC